MENVGFYKAVGCKYLVMYVLMFHSMEYCSETLAGAGPVTNIWNGTTSKFYADD